MIKMCVITGKQAHTKTAITSISSVKNTTRVLMQSLNQDLLLAP